MTSNSVSFALMLGSFGEIFGHSCHAMPISLIGAVGGAVCLMPPIFLEANGISVPISRGSPPGLHIQA